jgi:hypothetical protein
MSTFAIKGDGFKLVKIEAGFSQLSLNAACRTDGYTQKYNNSTVAAKISARGRKHSEKLKFSNCFGRGVV